VKAGLLRSQHGTHGGYVLARDAKKISAYEVIRAIDGPLFITSCVTIHGDCDQSDLCTIREPLKKVNQGIEDVLRGISIGDIPRRTPCTWGNKEIGRTGHAGLTGLEKVGEQ